MKGNPALIVVATVCILGALALNLSPITPTPDAQAYSLCLPCHAGLP